MFPRVHLPLLVMVPLMLGVSTPALAHRGTSVAAGLTNLRPIGFTEFRRAVLHGDEIKHRIVPSSFIVRVLEEASGRQQTSPRWRIRLKSSRVTCREITLTKSSRLNVQVDFTDVEVRSDVTLDNLTIEVPLTFKNVDFLGKVSFQGAVFEHTATFETARFAAYSNFSAAVIRQNLVFQECQFARQATFAKSVLPTKDSKFYLSGTSLEVPLDLSESTILGKITLEGAPSTLQVAATVYLNGINDGSSEPQGVLQVRNVEFQKNVYLDRGKWARVDFAESDKNGFHRPIKFLTFFDFRQTISNATSFAGAEFEAYGDLTGTQLRAWVSFERTKFRRPIQMHWKQIGERLANRDGDLFEQGHLSEEAIQTYDELERNFNQLGDLESANECHYQKRLFSDGRWLEWAVLGYGVRPRNPVFCILIALALFWILNFVFFDSFLGNTLPFSAFSNRRQRTSGALRLALYAAWWKKDLPAEYRPKALARRLFLVEYGVLKILWLALALAFMNTSPVLKEFVPYFLPK